MLSAVAASLAGLSLLGFWLAGGTIKSGPPPVPGIPSDPAHHNEIRQAQIFHPAPDQAPEKQPLPSTSSASWQNTQKAQPTSLTSFPQTSHNFPAATVRRTPPASSVGGAVAPQPAPAFEEIEIAAHPPIVGQIDQRFAATLPKKEQAALARAAQLFAETLSEYGPLDTKSEEYFYAYQESAQASDDFLRAYLGWDRFMALSAEGVKQVQKQLTSERAGTFSP